MKVKRVLVSLMAIIFIALIAVPQNVYATQANSPKILGITAKRAATDFGYSIGGPPYSNSDGSTSTAARLWDLIRYDSMTSSTYHTDVDMFCLNAKYGFGSDDDTAPANKRVEYTDYYDMKTERSAIESLAALDNRNDLKKLAGENYNAVLALGDMLYIKGQTSDEKMALLNAAGIKEYNDDSYGDGVYIHAESGKGPWFYLLTDDDIWAVEQAVLWYFTNADDKIDGKSIYDLRENANNNMLLYYSETNDADSNPASYNSLSSFNPEIGDGKDRQEQAGILYNYLIEAATQNASNYENQTDSGAPVRITAQQQYEEANSNYIIGPIKIEKINNIPFSVGEISVKNGNDAINYTILDKDKNITTKRGNDLVGDNFYISVPKDGIVSITISADVSYSKTKLELWTREENANTQPILIPSKEPASLPLRLTVGPESPKQFDLALRKYIVKVNDANITNVRNQKPDVSKLNTLDDNGNLITTAKYPHRKDPVLVETGDVVKYQIKIYNEGEKDGRATEIIDQLPTGLKIKIPTSGKVRSTKGNEYTITEDVANNKVTFTTTGENNLNKYENETLDSDTIEFECEVTATPNSQDNKILTNVAWISESYDAEADVKYSGNEIGHDRDSAPGTYPNVNKNNMKDYYGDEDNNKKDLTDNGFYYKGQQDDDDFEKLVLLPKKFDLALRKYITEVNGTNVANSRNPQPNTTELNTIKDGNLVTTATYAHRKDPVLVENGDVVTYKITIYNEGEKVGRATEITDQLPTGVKIKMPTSGKVTSTKGNEYTITEDVANNKVTFATTGANNLNKYENTTLDSDTIEFECEVTAIPDSQNRKILTNVAWISKSYDAEAKEEYSENEIGHDRDSAPGTHPNVNKDNMKDYKGNGNKDNLADNTYYYKGQQDDDDFEKLVLEPQVFDLKLIKNITEVNGNPVTERLKQPIDVSKLNIATNPETTATYKMDKKPVSVAKGDIVTYRLRVYNEGTIDGYAKEITEDIPEGLEFIWSEKEGEELDLDTTLTDAEKEAVRFNQRYLWGNFKYDDNREKIVEISTDYLSKEQETTVEGNLLTAFGKNDGTKTDSDLLYKDVFVKMKVVSENLTGITIRNEACISDDSDKDGNPIEDRDSTPEDWKKENSTKYYDNEHNWPVYKEDDEDYDNIILKPFDLALRKFIIAVSSDEEIEDDEYLKDDNGQYTRAPQVDTSKLNTLDNNGKMITTATYNHTKEPVRVKKNDIVVYMLRVYNEGEIDGYAAEIKDHLPEYLEFVDGEYNEQYGWTVSENGRTVTTKYLANQKIGAAEWIPLMVGGLGNDIGGGYSLTYKEVPIMCRVKDTAKVNEKITNIADITEYLDEDKKPVNDRDSSEDNVRIPEDKDLPKYKDDEHGDYIPGQEDDDDFEKVIIPRFDLALRKQIVNIHNNYKNQDKAYNDRFAKLDNSKNNTIYDYYDVESNIPTVVENDVVTYSIRVYNEGEVDGTATWVTDRLPSGLAYLPENETNKQYGWKAYKQSTKDSQNAIKIGEKYYEEVGFDSKEIYMYATEYLKDSVIKAYTGTGEANYEEVKMVARVKAKAEVPEGTEYKLRNIAEIGEDDNDDDDSTPGNESEWQDQDDVDIEELKLVEFDLALRKWVTEAIVIENEGTKNEKITVTPTGHQPYDDPEQVVKVELHRRKLSQVTVKFRYSIRVINEGDIPGYAKEVTDYIPQGLEFVAEDNTGWVDEGNNVISTRLLEKTLLNPGEYADVEVVLTWINSQDNMGVMVNTAEISQDENDYGVPDRDSVPDNQKPGEDDIDDAPVMLSITTGQERIYFILGFTVLITVAGGVILIKKYVL